MTLSQADNASVYLRVNSYYYEPASIIEDST